MKTIILKASALIIGSIAVSFLLTLILMCASLSASAQTVKPVNGVYKTITKDSVKAKDSGKVFEDSKGIKYPIWISTNGKYYVVRVSKTTGKEYKQYLKLD